MSDFTTPPESWLLIYRVLDQLELAPGATFLFHHVHGGTAMPACEHEPKRQARELKSCSVLLDDQ